MGAVCAVGADIPGGPRGIHVSIPYPSGDPVRRTGSPFFVGRGKPLPYGDGCTGVRDVQRDVEDAVPYGSETVGGLRGGGRGKPLPYGGRMNAGAGTGDTSSAPVCALGHLPLKGEGKRDVEDAGTYGKFRILFRPGRLKTRGTGGILE